MTDQLTLTLNECVPVPRWWPTGKYSAVIAPDAWEVANCNTFKRKLGMIDHPTFNAMDLPHHTYLPEGTYLMYAASDAIPQQLCLSAHLVDKKYRLAWDRSADIDLYLPYGTFAEGTKVLFSHFTTIYSTGDFPEELDIVHVT